MPVQALQTTYPDALQTQSMGTNLWSDTHQPLIANIISRPAGARSVQMKTVLTSFFRTQSKAEERAYHHREVHFLGHPVPVQHMCHTHFTQQQPQQLATTLRKYVLTIPETQMIQSSQASQAVHLVQVQVSKVTAQELVRDTAYCSS